MIHQLRPYFFLFTLTVLMVTACSSSNSGETNNGEATAGQAEVQDLNPDNNAQIKGTFKGAANQDVYLQKLNANQVINIDTVKTNDEGDFTIGLNVPQPDFYRVGLSEQNMCVLIIQPGEEVKVVADASGIFQTYTVQGSPESRRLKKLNAMLGKRDSVGLALQDAQMRKDQAAFQQAMGAYEALQVSLVKSIKSFIDEDPGKLSSLAAAQNLDAGEDMAYYEKVINALEGKVDGNEFYEVMKLQIQRSRKLAVGSEAPEIELSQPNGDLLSLSDLRGQFVLIDFWASWCGPCRRENPNVVRVYNKYHDKGFEILGVSLDKNKKAWLTAIEQDGLEWKHISDLKYWNSAVVPEYQIQGIPLTYLVDPEGKIVAKNLRGASLEDKLAEIFK